MKRIFTLFAAVMLIASCAFAQNSKRLSTPAQRTSPVKFTQVFAKAHHMNTPKDGETSVNLLEAGYYAQDYLEVSGTQVEVDLYFCTEGISLDEEGYIQGSGQYMQVYVITPSVDENLLPEAGTYTVSDTYAANTLVAGNDPYADIFPGFATDGTLIYTVDEEVEENNTMEFITGGTMTIAYGEEGTTMTMNLTTENANSINWIYSGPIEVGNYAADPEDAFSDYEPTEPTTLTIAGTPVIDVTPDLLTISVTDPATSQSFMTICYTSNSQVNGTYTVSDSEEPGTMPISAGCDGYSVYYPIVATVDADGYISANDPIYFVASGSITIADNGITGTLTSHYGTTITLQTAAPSVGINGVQASATKVFPTMASSTINVIAEGVQNIQIVDINGRVVMESRQAGAINVENLAKGLYVVRTITNNGTSTQKIVKK